MQSQTETGYHLRQLFRDDPYVSRESTELGMPAIARTPDDPRRWDLFMELAGGPFLAGFDSFEDDPCVVVDGNLEMYPQREIYARPRLRGKAPF